MHMKQNFDSLTPSLLSFKVYNLMLYWSICVGNYHMKHTFFWCQETNQGHISGDKHKDIFVDFNDKS
jgi:hypothetical protein